MHNLLSPQYSNPNKQELFKNRSPSFRSKRIPSVQDPYLCSSNQNLRVSKQDSPSKCSEEIRRRKSHYLQGNNLSNSGNKKRQKGSVAQNTDTQNIINSIHDLKEQYRTLRQAYKELIQEKIKNSEEMVRVIAENSQLKNQLQEKLRNEEEMKHEIISLQDELESVRVELERQRKNKKKLQNDLYFMTERQKSKTDTMLHCRGGAFGAADDQEDDIFGSCKEAIEEISSKTNTNESHILSFSLTSVIDESFKLQQLHRRRKEHVKVVSDLSHTGGLKNEFSNVDIKPKKDSTGNFKKHKKESKMEVINQSKESKVSSMGNPLNQLLNLKSPVSQDKKSIKNLMGVSSSKRKKNDEKENLDVRNPKKKSKKVLHIGANQ